MSGAKGQRVGYCGDLSVADIRTRRSAGETIRDIALAIGICEEAVKTFCHRHRIVTRWGGARHRGIAVVPGARVIFATAMCEMAEPVPA